jgi:hypothetical protein
VPTAWRFERDGTESTVALEPHFSTNENESAIAAAVAGYGVTSTSARAQGRLAWEFGSPWSSRNGR